MTIFIISWFISGLVAALINRFEYVFTKGYPMKMPIFSYLLHIIFGYISLVFMLFLFVFPSMWDKFIVLLNKEI